MPSQVRYPAHVHLLRGNHESKGMAYQCSHLLLPAPLSTSLLLRGLTFISSPLLRIDRYSLHEECPGTYGTGVALELLFEVFRCLPLAAVVNETVGAPLSTHSLHQLSGDLLHFRYTKIFCVHSGLSPSASTIEDLAHIDRYSNPSFSNLTWCSCPYLLLSAHIIPDSAKLMRRKV
jgi:hypothetical protein